MKKQRRHQPEGKDSLEATPELLTTTEAAAYLNISVSYLYKLTSQRLVAHFKPNGKKLVFRKEDLNKYLLRNRVSSLEEIEQEAVNRVTLR